MENIVTEKSKQLGIILSGSFAGFMVLLDGNIVNVSLPYIAKYFNIGTSYVVQITLVYLLILSGVMIIVGKLADRTGLKKIFIWGFVIFTISSLLCGLSPYFSILILARAIQAVGGAMLFSTAVALIPKFIPAEKRGWGFGILSPINSLGLLVGAPLGGLITDFLNWHWIFLVNVPIGIIAIIVAKKVIPDDTILKDDQRNKPRFDYLGSILSFLGLTLLVFFLNQGRKIGWTSPIVIGGLGTAILLLVLFYLREKKAPDPVLELTIFKNKNFSLGILASFLGFGLMTGSSVLMPFYLTYILHISVAQSGFILMTFALIFSILSPVTGRLSDHISKTRLTSAGMVLAIISCLFFLFFLPRMHLVVVVSFLAMMGLSYAFFITPNNNLVMSLAPSGKQSISSSIFKLSTNLGQLCGVLVMETMFTLCLPGQVHSTASQLQKATNETLLSGFQYSYMGGCALVSLALLVSLFIKDTSAPGVVAEEPHFL